MKKFIKRSFEKIHKNLKRQKIRKIKSPSHGLKCPKKKKLNLRRVTSISPKKPMLNSSFILIFWF
ncbi:hypothetical protein D6829_02875 [Candidatus Pacearchaeota archaeon]|nr:MAG: hypothetical protein D6829_02875 [Candidatus Pacearchaeota archaeon]